MADDVLGPVPRMSYIASTVPPAPASAGSNPPKSIGELSKALEAKFKGSVIKILTEAKGQPSIVVKTEMLHEIVRFLRDDSQFLCTNLDVISSTDFPARQAKEATADEAAVPAQEARIETAYVLFSYQFKHSFLLKVYLDREHPKVQSISDLYRAANWYERECYDLVGVHFSGHPDLQRVLLPQDWVGHPLRKDYVFPEEYNGMKVPL